MGLSYIGYSISLTKIASVLKSDQADKENKLVKILLRDQEIDVQLLLDFSGRIKNCINTQGLLDLTILQKMYDDISDIIWIDDSDKMLNQEDQAWLNSAERVYYLKNKDLHGVAYDDLLHEKDPVKIAENLEFLKQVPTFGGKLIKAISIKSEKDLLEYKRIEAGAEKEAKSIKNSQEADLKAQKRRKRLALLGLDENTMQHWAKQRFPANSFFSHFIYDVSNTREEFMQLMEILKPYQDPIMDEIKVLREKMRTFKFQSAERAQLVKDIKRLISDKFNIIYSDQENSEGPATIYDISKILNDREKINKQCLKQIKMRDVLDLINGMIDFKEETLFFDY